MIIRESNERGKTLVQQKLEAYSEEIARKLEAFQQEVEQTETCTAPRSRKRK